MHLRRVRTNYQLRNKQTDRVSSIGSSVEQVHKTQNHRHALSHLVFEAGDTVETHELMVETSEEACSSVNR